MRKIFLVLGLILTIISCSEKEKEAEPVPPATLTSITLTPQIQNLPVDTQQTLKATGKFSNGNERELNTSLNLKWIPSNPEILSAEKGVIKGISPGIAEVTAKLGEIEAKNSINVVDISPTSLKADFESLKLPLGSNESVSIKGVFPDSTEFKLIPSKITWSSSEASFVTVDAEGKLKAISKGNSTLKIVYKNLTLDIPIEVTTASLQSIVLSTAKTTWIIGEKETLTATGNFSDGNSGNISGDTGLVWSSSDEDIAQVDSKGAVTTVGAGDVRITLKKGNITGFIDITVKDTSLQSIALLPPNITEIAKDSIQAFKAFGTYADQTVKEITFEVTWSSSDQLVATISNIGVATALEQGTTTITATFGTISGTATLRVR